MIQYCSIVGLPSSGKTTFLAALWHLLNAGEIPTSLALGLHTGDNRHLNDLVQRWRRCDQVLHTSLGDEATVNINLLNPLTGQKLTVAFPDLSGESFESQFETRTCERSYLESYEAETGTLAFVNANRPTEDLTLNELAPLLAAEPATQATRIEPWTPRLASEQVRLVDLLQFMQRPPFPTRRKRLAIIVSAWDVVPIEVTSPEQWLQVHRPLLHQFLLTNAEFLDYRVYGVSAQGGDVAGPAKDELLKKVKPSVRVICRAPDGSTSHDLTIPIAWLLAGP